MAFVVAVFVASMVFLSIAVHMGGASAAELAKNPTAAIIVPAMTLGYIVMLAVLYARVSSAHGVPFWKTIAGAGRRDTAGWRGLLRAGR